MTGRPIEGLGDRRPPVDDQWLTVAVAHPEAADVEPLDRPGTSIGVSIRASEHVDSPEAEGLIADREGPASSEGRSQLHVAVDAVAERPALAEVEDVAGDARRASPQFVEPAIGAIDVGLFGPEFFSDAHVRLSPDRAHARARFTCGADYGLYADPAALSIPVASRSKHGPVRPVAAVTVVDTVATTQRRRPAHAKPKGKASAAKSTAKSTAARGRAKGPAKRPSHTKASKRTRSYSPAALLGRPATELAGFACVAVGVLAALGIWFDLTGPTGRVARTGASGAFGWVGYLVPAILCGAGAALLQERSLRRPGPVIAGYGLMLTSMTGLLHLLDKSGGAVGSGIGRPLITVLAPWGAGVVFMTVLVLACLVVTDISVPAAIAGIKAAGAWVARLVGSVAHSLGTVTAVDGEAERRGRRRTSGPPAAAHHAAHGRGRSRRHPHRRRRAA